MAGKMDKMTITVLAVVGSFGVLSAILGFSAEGTKLTRCYYYSTPANPSVGLGVCAALFLIVAQVIFAVVGGCCGSCNSGAIPSETNRTNGLICAVGSWIAAVTAFVLFVVGASYDTGYNSSMECWVLKPGIFAGGALLALAATALGLTSYVMLRRLPAVASPNTGGGEQLPTTAAAPNTGGGAQLPVAAAAGIATGQPQFPQQPRPQGSGQAPPPKFLQQPRPQGYGQAPPPKFLQKPRPPTHPKYQQPSAPPHGMYKESCIAPNFPPPPPTQGYPAHTPNQQYPPPPHPAPTSSSLLVLLLLSAMHRAHVPNQQAPPPQGHQQV